MTPTEKLTDMSIAEQYYNERIKSGFDEPFDELSDEYKIAMTKTTAYAFFEFGLAFDNLINSIKNHFNKTN